MKELESFIGLRRCPACLANNFVREAQDSLKCISCGIQYPVAQGSRPVLLRPDNQLFRQEDYHHDSEVTTGIVEYIKI